MPSTSGISERDQDDALSLLLELVDELIDLLLGSPRRHRGSARPGSAPLGRVSSPLAMATFCWLPPESSFDQLILARGLMLNRRT